MKTSAVCFSVLCILVLVSSSHPARAASQCKAISTEIENLKKYLSTHNDMGEAHSTAEKKQAAAELKAINAELSNKEFQLKQCLASASLSGGEPFSMQGGILLTASQIANSLTPCSVSAAPPAPPQPSSNSQSPPPAASWRASSCVKGNPSDAQIAASATHVVVTFENSMAWYDKTGAKQGELTNFDLFKPLLATLASVIGMGQASSDCINIPNATCARTQSDFRVIFDEYRKRFWVLDGAGIYAADKNPAKARGIFMVAVSKSQDPKDGWYLYWMDAVAHWGKTNDKIYQPGDGADYPSIGIDPFGFHVTNPVGSVNGKAKYTHVSFFRADDNKAISGIPPQGWHFYDLHDPKGELITSVIQPVVHHGATGRAYYVNTYGHSAQNDEVLVWALTNPMQPAQHLQRVTVKLVDPTNGKSVPFNSPQDAPQKSGGSTKLIRMTNLGTAILKAVYRAGSLHFVGNDAQGWFSSSKLLTSVRLVRLNVLGFPSIPTVGDPKYINRRFGKNGPGDSPQDQVHYGWPAVEVNKKGDMTIVYARSGTTLFPEVRYSTHFGTEKDLRPSRLLQAGSSTFGTSGTNRWADTAGAAVDPADDTGIWIAQQYASGPGSWDIWVGKVFGN